MLLLVAYRALQADVCAFLPFSLLCQVNKSTCVRRSIIIIVISLICAQTVFFFLFKLSYVRNGVDLIGRFTSAF